MKKTLTAIALFLVALLVALPLFLVGLIFMIPTCIFLFAAFIIVTLCLIFYPEVP